MPHDTWDLIWSDEFDGSVPDPAVWVPEQGYIRNNERQRYTNDPANMFIEDGHLVIQAIRTGDPSCPYTSASLTTQGTMSMLYGRIEVRAKLPFGQGIWPAIWTLGYGEWPECGEIDIMELVGGPRSEKCWGDHIVQGSLHYAGEKSGQAAACFCMLPEGQIYHDAFHVFALEWTPTNLTWYVDGDAQMIVGIQDIPEFHQPHFLLLNLAVGGNWPGDPDDTTCFPQRYEIDWVRYYRQKEA